MAKFLGISQAKWLSIILLLCVMIISLLFSVLMKKKPALREGLLDETKINKVNCEFRKYVELVEALCNFHITGNTPTGGSPDLSPYMLKESSYLLNLGLSSTDSSTEAMMLEEAKEENVSYTEKMKRIYKMYKEKKETIKSQELIDLINTHYSNRIAILNDFLMILSKMIPSESAEDSNLSNKITLALDSPKVFTTGVGEKASFEDLYNAFKTTYEESITAGYSC